MTFVSLILPGVLIDSGTKKTLVLKELKKLWDKEEPDHLPWQQGDLSPSNTLLVDDSPLQSSAQSSTVFFIPNKLPFFIMI